MRSVAAIGFVVIIFGCVPCQAEAFKPDRASFFAKCAQFYDFSQARGGRAVRTSKRRLTSTHRATINLLFDHWEKVGDGDKRKLAYILATAYRETHGTLLPIREAPSCGLDESCRERKINARYARPESNGKRYYGRGYPQLTSGELYLRFGQRLGLGSELYDNPDLALDPDISKRALIEGMLTFKFAHTILSDFFSSEVEDWVGARNILNPGSQRKEATAEYGMQFNRCL